MREFDYFDQVPAELRSRDALCSVPQLLNRGAVLVLGHEMGEVWGECAALKDSLSAG